MRIPFLASTLFVGIVGMMATSSAFAFCNPVISDDLTKRVVCSTNADTTCSQIGTSIMDGDKKSIIICLASSAGSNCAAGNCHWKKMTSDGGLNQCYRVYGNGSTNASGSLISSISQLGHTSVPAADTVAVAKLYDATMVHLAPAAKARFYSDWDFSLTASFAESVECLSGYTPTSCSTSPSISVTGSEGSVSTSSIVFSYENIKGCVVGISMPAYNSGTDTISWSNSFSITCCKNQE